MCVCVCVCVCVYIYIYINIYKVKRMWMALNQVVGIVVVYRTRMLAVTGSNQCNSVFCFIYIYIYTVYIYKSH